MIEVGQTIQATVEKLTYGGQGLIRHQGWVIFVEDVAPQEEVEVVITAKKKSYFQAKLSRVLTPSPIRITPACPYFGTCGGCQLQHLDYDEQLNQKVEWLKESLIRIAKVPVVFPLHAVKAKKPWGYRQKIILHGPRGGYFARDNLILLEIESCPIFSKQSLDSVRKILARCDNLTHCDTTVMRDSDENLSIHIYFEPRLPRNADQLIAKYPNLWLSDHIRSLGPKEPLCRIQDGLKMYYSPQVFVQNDPDQSLMMYQDVLNLITDGPILDLYCGIGALSLMAAKRSFEVFGVELNAQAIEFAKKSASENGLRGIEFMAGPAEEIGAIVENKKFPTWIVNPPRTGLSEKMVEIVVKERPKHLIYISCKPPTLARDVGIFCKNGYKIKQGTVYDMFAQTTHLETALLLCSA
jgi:23S rRNA (uracil1939-C5)-methyltransferase